MDLKRTAKLGVFILSAVTILTPVTSFADTASGASPPTLGSGEHHRQGDDSLHTYPNLFHQAGYTQTQINEKLNADWQQFFHGTPGTGPTRYNGQTVYYQLTPNMAYIEDIGDQDVRTEGMGYGMMIAVQLNHKKEFDSLWNYAKTYMQIKSGPTKDYFAWHTTPDGKVLSYSVAPDGDQWIAAALAFAAGRWGNGTGIYNYRQQSKQILHAMWHNSDTGGVDEFSHTTYLPTFSPPNALSYTDPSYSLPAFYKIFASVDASDAKLWNKAYAAGENLLKHAYQPTTGLAPDYANFNGTPYMAAGETTSDNAYDHNFQYDAWRAIANANVDAAWFGVKPWETQYSNTLENFFWNQPGSVNGYESLYHLDGTPISQGQHSPGLVAMNASSAIAASYTHKVDFVNALWDTTLPSGQWRYYDGMLYMLGMLYDSGNFKMWWHPVENRDYPHQMLKRVQAHQ
jgi:oligosaccharide reducing-end xylanase